jgi:hypothetical protein
MQGLAIRIAKARYTRGRDHDAIEIDATETSHIRLFADRVELSGRGGGARMSAQSAL